MHKTYFLVSSFFFLAVSSFFGLEVLSASEFFAMYREIDQLYEPDPWTQHKFTWEQI